MVFSPALRNQETQELVCVSRLMGEFEMLRMAQPKKMENEFDSIAPHKNGEANLRNARFKNRVRLGKQVCYSFFDYACNPVLNFEYMTAACRHDSRRRLRNPRARHPS